MRKIAILNCQKALSVCTGASCLKALHHRKGTFTRYENEDVELVAFWYCNGCGVPLSDAGLQEKMETIKDLGVDIIHVGGCTRRANGVECKLITEMAENLSQDGIQIIRGTHPMNEN